MGKRKRRSRDRSRDISHDSRDERSSSRSHKHRRREDRHSRSHERNPREPRSSPGNTHTSDSSSKHRSSSCISQELEYLRKRLDRYEQSRSLSLCTSSRRSRSPSVPFQIQRETEEDQENLIINPKNQDSSEVLVLTDNSTLEEEVLEALGEGKQKGKKSYDLHLVLKNRWGEILKGGLQKEDRAILIEKHPIPNNLDALTSPSINMEIKKAIPSIVCKKDKFFESTQTKLGHGISALGEGLSEVVKDNNSILTNKHKLITAFSESAKILLDVHYSMSLNRRYSPNHDRV